MRFFCPWMLLLIPVFAVLALAAYWLLRRGNVRLSLFATPELLARTGLAASAARAGGAPRFAATPFLQIALLTAGLFLLAVAAARPQWGRADFHASSRGRSLLIALDVSRSMLAADVHPNRLERAKVDILDLIADLKGDSAGILVFRGKGLMLCPLTTDYAFLRQAVDGITIDSAPRGETDIADAITKCLEALEGADGDNCAILLISDGEDLAGRAKRAAEKAGERNIPIFTVGIGDPSGSVLPAPDGRGNMKFGGKEVRSSLTESTLREISKASGGVYIPLATSGTAATTLGAIYRQHLTKIAARELDEMLENRYVERFQLFLVPALLLLLAAAALSRGRPAPSRRRAATTATLLLALLLATPGFAESGEPVATRRERRVAFNDALDRYRADDATNAAAILLPFSADRDFPEAAELYGASAFRLAYDPELATNASARIEWLSKASAGFRAALAAAPDDERRQRNLSRATAPIPALRREAHLLAVKEKFAQTPPQALVTQLLLGEREILERSAVLATNANAAARIAGLEALAARQRDASDICIALRPVLLDPAVITNEAQRAEAERHFDAMEGDMGAAAEALDDIDADGARSAAASAEDVAFAFWTAVAEPPALIDEDILCETNVVVAPLERKWPNRDDSATALALTGLFAERFPKWAEAYIQQDAQRRQQEGSTNAPSFTEENVAQIQELIEPLLWVQRDALGVTNMADKVGGAAEAHDMLLKIRDLLPKNPGGASGSPQAQPQPQQQNEQQQNEEQQNEQQQGQEQQEQEEQQQEEEQKGAEEKDEEPPPDVQEALRKAVQREREHEAEKQRRRREYPMPPNSRDW